MKFLSHTPGPRCATALAALSSLSPRGSPQASSVNRQTNKEPAPLNSEINTQKTSCENSLPSLPHPARLFATSTFHHLSVTPTIHSLSPPPSTPYLSHSTLCHPHHPPPICHTPPSVTPTIHPLSVTLHHPPPICHTPPSTPFVCHPHHPPLSPTPSTPVCHSHHPPLFVTHTIHPVCLSPTPPTPVTHTIHPLSPTPSTPVTHTIHPVIHTRLSPKPSTPCLSFCLSLCLKPNDSKWCSLNVLISFCRILTVMIVFRVCD